MGAKSYQPPHPGHKTNVIMKKYLKTNEKVWRACEELPTVKMEEKGIGSLTVAETLAIIIGNGTKTLSAIEIAKALMEKAEWSLEVLSRMKHEEIAQIKGIGEIKAKKIMAAFEIGTRRQEEKAERIQVQSSRQAAEMMMPKMQNLPHEEFWVMYLNHSNRVVAKKRISTGGVSSTVVDPKMILKEALMLLATGMILFHNHPSGGTEPSNEDIKLTKKLLSASQALDLRVLDHVIVSGQDYYSFADSHML